MDNIEVMQSQFNIKIHQLKATKGKNNQLFTKQEYFDFLSKLKQIKAKRSGKTPNDYQRAAKYDVIQVDNVERLIQPVQNKHDRIIYYTFLEENFQIIHTIHLAIGHGGRNRMMHEIKTKYKNITSEFVMAYLSLCELCQTKVKTSKSIKENRSITVARCQVSLIDMRSQADEQFKFIMVCEDHTTKFIQIRALTTKRANEVAHNLLDIFTVFGVPSVLHTDNQKFTDTIIKEIGQMWNEIKILRGKSSLHSSFDIRNQLATYSTKWTQAIKFIQFKQNGAYHSAIGRSPYEAMFGCRIQNGLNTLFPASVLARITSEEELDDLQLGKECKREESDTNSMDMEIREPSVDFELIKVEDLD